MLPHNFMELIAPISRGDLMVMYHGDPLFQTINRHFEAQLERLSMLVPQNEFGDSVRLLVYAQRITNIALLVVNEQASQSPKELRERLKMERDNLESFLRKCRSDELDLAAKGEITRTEYIEGLLLFRQGEFASARTEFQKVFEWDEANAKPEAELGYRCATQAVAAATLMFRARELGTDLDFVRRMTARTLAMLDHFDNSVLSGDKTGTNAERNSMLSLARTQVLAIKAERLLTADAGASRELRIEARGAAVASIEAAKKCPKDWTGNAEFLAYTGLALSCLGTVILLENQYQDAWTAREKPRRCSSHPLWTPTSYLPTETGWCWRTLDLSIWVRSTEKPRHTAGIARNCGRCIGGGQPMLEKAKRLSSQRE